MVRNRRRRRRFLGRARRLLSLIVVGLFFAGGWWYLQLPDVRPLARENPSRTALMLQREKGGVKGRPIWVPLERIAPELRNAVIVAEDADFYRHQGVDWDAVWDAVEKNWREGRIYRGGSTITQQLAKNLYLDPSKTASRKIKEAVIAMRMEHRLSKSRILELYLNVAEWGRGIYGAEAAARHYYGKSAADLTITEASWLAAILPSPWRYESHQDSQYVQRRADWIARFVERRLAGQRVRVAPAAGTPPARLEQELEPAPLSDAAPPAPGEQAGAALEDIPPMESRPAD